MLTIYRDQELRFTVHDSPDYHQLKVSVFNDDKKTELIGETWVSLEDIIRPGGGQSDIWHPLNCKGKYAGDIRIELTFYDTRPKEEKAPVEKRESSTVSERSSPAVGGSREMKPVKRRPLPSDPTGASPSPVGERRGLQGVQAGPRGLNTPPRQQRGNEQTPSSQRRAQQPDTPLRRPLPESMTGTPSSNPPTPQNQQHPDAYQTPPNPRTSSSNLGQYNEDGFDMSYAAPKPYEMQPADSLPQHVRDPGRTMSQDDFRSSRGHSPRPHMDLPHAHSMPSVPTHNMYEEPQQDPYGGGAVYSNRHVSPQPDAFSLHQYQDQQYQIEPLRLSRNSRSNERMTPHDPYYSPNTIMDSPDPYDQYAAHGRRASAMQPTVEDEDDVPPPPPVHRSNASTLVQQPMDYRDDTPAPLNSSRHRDDQSYIYESPTQSYDTNGYGHAHHERRYTHPHPSSRPVSRDTMAPSPLRNETAMIPASLLAGVDASHQNRDSASYQTPPSQEVAQRPRQYSEPDFRAPQHHDTSPRPHPLAHHESADMTDSVPYWQRQPPQEPRRRSPSYDPAPIIKPRAVSPAASPMHPHTYSDDRSSRVPGRSMPTRKSVSPRPPPSGGDERRLSGVPFDPDSFDVFNPSTAKPANDPERPGSSMEMNDKGQIVTFSGRVIDASDHLPVDSWAPEPERKGTEKVHPARSRPQLSGARDLEAAKQREERYRRERADREKIRNATMATFGSAESPSSALVTSRHQFSTQNSSANSGTMVLADRDATPPSSGRNRLQKRNQPRPMSTTYDSPTHGTPVGIPVPNTNVLRERENLGGYGSDRGYGREARHSIAAPPIPAKIPLGGGGGGGDEISALSLELQSIDIGSGSAGRRTRGGATAARRYGY
jgi:hypothetical protein